MAVFERLTFLLLAYTLQRGLSSHFLRLANRSRTMAAFERLFHPEPVLGIVPIVAGLIAAAGNWGMVLICSRIVSTA